MKYDFETLIPRYGVGSGKWDEMREEIPDIPDDIVPLSVADMEFKNAPEIPQFSAIRMRRMRIIGR